jgi:hypothetical protein
MPAPLDEMWGPMMPERFELLAEIKEWIINKRKRLADYESGKLSTKEQTADGRLVDSTERTIREIRKEIADHKSWADELSEQMAKKASQTSGG